MRRFLLLATACFLLIVIGLPCAALYAVVYTQSGLQFVVRHLPQRYGNVGVQDRGCQRHDRWRRPGDACW